jgi:intracellular septation protein
MKLLFDFFPVLLFFVAFKFFGIYTATAAAIAASCLQTGIFWFKHRRFDTTHLVTLALITVFGGATLLLQDETFIKWKPTALNWLFGLAFLASHFLSQKTLVERLMGASMTLPPAVWVRLNVGWATFFVFLGCVNLYVAYHFDTDTWVNFKLFGMMGLTLAFAAAQAVYVVRYLKTDDESAEGP